MLDDGLYQCIIMVKLTLSNTQGNYLPQTCLTHSYNCTLLWSYSWRF